MLASGDVVVVARYRQTDYPVVWTFRLVLDLSLAVGLYAMALTT